MNLEIPTPPPRSTEIALCRAKCESIKVCIETYLAKNPLMSLQSIETKTGMPISTLRRIVNLQGNPNPENVIKLCLALGFDRELVHYLEQFHPDLAAVMTLKNSHNKEYVYVKEAETKYFSEESSFLILSLAYTTAGTSEEEIRFELGERGVAELVALAEKGLLLRADDGRYVGTIENFKLPFSEVKKRVELALRHYRLEEAGGINNWLSYQTESLNDEGIVALKMLNQKQFNERKDQIFKNPSFIGNKKVYSIAVSSSFVKYKGLEVLQ